MTTEITRADVRYLWHWAYYDGPLSGACLWRGARYWFVCVDDGGDNRTFHLVELTDEEWAFEDNKHAAFRKFVGTHTDYDEATQRQTLGALKPESERKKFYEAYPRGKADTHLRRDRPAVARYTV